MDIGSVERMRPVEQVGVRRGPADVTPALGVEASERMEDDSYRNADSGPKRGMDDSPENDDPEEADCPPGAGDKISVSLFA